MLELVVFKRYGITTSKPRQEASEGGGFLKEVVFNIGSLLGSK